MLFIFFISALILSQSALSQASDFVTKWDLSKTGTAGNNSISFFTTNAAGSVAYTWQELSPGSSSGSGSFSAGTAVSRSITGLPTNVLIELRISTTNLQRFYTNGAADPSRLIDVTQWGSTAWTSMESMFFGCNNLNITSTDVPNLSNATSMKSMFYLCTSLNGPTNIGNWNTSNITSMENLFYVSGAFNQDIGSWNTASVTNMTYMFSDASSFNKNIGNWNTGNVTNMSYMFQNSAFNQNISGWNTSKVTTMVFMFKGASAFNNNGNSSIGNWNTANVTNMSDMFKGATAFNQDIGNWNTAKVTTMSRMFQEASAFNQNIGNWNTANVTEVVNMFHTARAFNNNSNSSIGNWNMAKVTDMSNMFLGAWNFNQPIGSWNTASATDMSQIFYDTKAFNQNIENWNTASVTLMSRIFFNAIAFNQNIGNWVLNSSVTLTDMLSGSGMNCDNYSRTLAGWALTTPATGRSLGATGLTYGTNVSSLRSLLTTPTGSGGKGWTISGDAVSSGTCGPAVFYSKSTGDLDDVANWGTNTNGTGTAPTDFTASNQYFAIRNRSAASILGNWSTTGANSLVVLGDGTNAITFTTGTNTIIGNYKLSNNATLAIGSNPTGLNFICENGATVNYNGSSAQTIAPGNYNNLSISGSNTKTLGSDIIIRGTLSLSNKLTLDAYSISLSGTVSGAGSSYYVQTNGVGTLKKSITSIFLFPVGNSAYNPVTITNNTGTADDFTVRVQDAVYVNGLSGTTVSTPRVDRTWQIGKTSGSSSAGSGVDFVFQWDPGQETGSITSYQLNHHNGSRWNFVSGAAMVSEFGSPKTLTFTQYKGSFSPFAISHGLSPLPVTWLSFTGERINNRVQLNWSTASEQNSSHFDVERSTNGIEFTNIGRESAAGNSQSTSNYAHWDAQPLNGISYYRLRQVDQNGNYSFSRVLQLKHQTTTAARIIPNPTHGPINLQISSDWTGTYDCRVFNALGVLVENRRGLRAGSHMVDLSKNAKGLYQFTLWSNGQQIQQQWVMKN
jgi:surface protein